MNGLPMECPEEERPGSLSRALVDVPQNLFQDHSEMYFENPSLKVNEEREGGSTCLLYDSPSTGSSLRSRAPLWHQGQRVREGRLSLKGLIEVHFNMLCQKLISKCPYVSSK